MAKNLPELNVLEKVLDRMSAVAEVASYGEVTHRDRRFPLYGITLGSRDPEAPTFCLVGGVHGLERIGSQVVIAFMQSISEVLQWDEQWHERLRRARLAFFPVVNPIGIHRLSRANGNGVDLMRNAPVLAESAPFLLGGQQISPRLPWYRGQVQNEQDMELEARALIRFVREKVLSSQRAIAVDVHSGFGVEDRLWFPYSKSRTPPPHLVQIAALKRLFDSSYPNHFYRIEPQAKAYTIHGDLWDYLYDEAQAKSPRNFFVPWTLELGSWLWLKKNPWQIFSPLGPFNPIKPHRQQRILRRHLPLFDFMLRALLSPRGWLQPEQDQARQLLHRAQELWYE